MKRYLIIAALLLSGCGDDQKLPEGVSQDGNVFTMSSSNHTSAYWLCYNFWDEWVEVKRIEVDGPIVRVYCGRPAG